MRQSSRTALFAFSVALSVGCGVAWSATPPETGLGQAWPNASDSSLSPRYHVYVFERSGIRYVQVNDTSGKVRGAVAVIGSELVGLPVGSDASRWLTPQEGSVDGSSVRAAEPVYQDGSVRVSVAPQADGTARLFATEVDCKNPAECSVRGP